MGKLSNIVTMIQLLNTGKKYTVDELSKILEVTPRIVITSYSIHYTKLYEEKIKREKQK